jgi:hypothetical protein
MDDDTDDDLLLNPEAERILERAVDLMIGLHREGFTPGVSIKVLVSAVCMVIQNGSFGISKNQIARDISTTVTNVAARQQAEEDNNRDQTRDH